MWLELPQSSLSIVGSSLTLASFCHTTNQQSTNDATDRPNRQLNLLTTTHLSSLSLIVSVVKSSHPPPNPSLIILWWIRGVKFSFVVNATSTLCKSGGVGVISIIKPTTTGRRWFGSFCITMSASQSVVSIWHTLFLSLFRSLCRLSCISCRGGEDDNNFVDDSTGRLDRWVASWYIKLVARLANQFSTALKITCERSEIRSSRAG